MTTEVNTTVPVPEQTVVGTGLYVVPANRYGFIDGTATHAAVGNSYQTSGGGAEGSSSATTASASTAKLQQWLTAGDTISTSTSNPSGSSNAPNSQRVSSGYARIVIGSTVVCEARAAASASGRDRNNFNFTSQTTHYSNVGWSISLFRIPKANLPTGTAEGE